MISSRKIREVIDKVGMEQMNEDLWLPVSEVYKGLVVQVKNTSMKKVTRGRCIVAQDYKSMRYCIVNGSFEIVMWIDEHTKNGFVVGVLRAPQKKQDKKNASQSEWLPAKELRRGLKVRVVHSSLVDGMKEGIYEVAFSSRSDVRYCISNAEKTRTFFLDLHAKNGVLPGIKKEYC